MRPAFSGPLRNRCVRDSLEERNTMKNKAGESRSSWRRIRSSDYNTGQTPVKERRKDVELRRALTTA
jgi:hypothetical protein